MVPFSRVDASVASEGDPADGAVRWSGAVWQQIRTSIEVEIGSPEQFFHDGVEAFPVFAAGCTAPVQSCIEMAFERHMFSGSLS